MKIQPEKYYEACITHHLVNYFEFTLDKKLYPFSISQIEEKNKGYDFGYKISSKSFFIQFKRPFKSITGETYHWKIEIEQLNTINRMGDNLYTYYALPSFANSEDWYEAMDKTFFINAHNLERQIEQLNSGKRLKTTTIDSKKIRLNSWNDLSKRFESTLNNVSTAEKINMEDSKDIMNYVNSLDEDLRKSTWLYIVGDE